MLPLSAYIIFVLPLEESSINILLKKFLSFLDSINIVNPSTTLINFPAWIKAEK